MVLWLANLVDRGKDRGVQRLDRKDEPQGFYLGPDLHVLFGFCLFGSAIYTEKPPTKMTI